MEVAELLAQHRATKPQMRMLLGRAAELSAAPTPGGHEAPLPRRAAGGAHVLSPAQMQVSRTRRSRTPCARRPRAPAGTLASGSVSSSGSPLPACCSPAATALAQELSGALMQQEARIEGLMHAVAETEDRLRAVESALLLDQAEPSSALNGAR